MEVSLAYFVSLGRLWNGLPFLFQSFLAIASFQTLFIATIKSQQFNMIFY